MRCIVTAGPTWEPLDCVRRLTNASTGSLGGRLANHLAQGGHDVTLLLGETSVWRSPIAAVDVRSFSSTVSLGEALKAVAHSGPAAVFHAAAVSDFSGGDVFRRDGPGELQPVRAGKISTRSGSLLVELRPTPKILPQLSGWFPRGRIVGWKFEVDGDREAAVAAGRNQLCEARTHACVINGPAYGAGYGLLLPDDTLTPLPDPTHLFAALARLATAG